MVNDGLETPKLQKVRKFNSRQNVFSQCRRENCCSNNNLNQQFQFSVENSGNFNDFEETIDISNDFEETIENFNGFEESIENFNGFGGHHHY